MSTGGIIRSFNEGLLTSASIIAPGEAAKEALSLARDTPGLDMGVHLTLCDERPVRRPRDLSSIIPSGDRLPSRNHLLKMILLRRIDYREVEAEWCAQVKAVLNAGIRISHLDSHQFVHLFPGLISICLKIVRTYDIPFVRGLIIDPASLQAGLKRLIQCTGLAVWSRFYASRLLKPFCSNRPIGRVSIIGRKANQGCDPQDTDRTPVQDSRPHRRGHSSSWNGRRPYPSYIPSLGLRLEKRPRASHRRRAEKRSGPFGHSNLLL